MKYLVLAAIGALASILANKSIAVFNDGFRPIVPQYLDGGMSRKDLAAMSFAISFGLVIGFGIPTIILIHSVLLTTDIIGTWCPDTKTGTILAGVIGALYGVGILAGLELIVNLFALLPFNFLSNLGSVSTYVVAAFACFPAVAVGYQHGFKNGAISGIITLIVYVLTVKFGQLSMGSSTVTLNAFGVAMLAGMICMLVFASKVKGDGNSNSTLVSTFSTKVSRIRSNWWLFAIMGALIAAATSMGIVAGDPASLALVADSQWSNATVVALARAIGFVPLVFTTGIVTGVYAPAGCTFVFVIGLAFHGNPLLAAVLGAVVMVCELALINVFAKGMDKFPGMKDMGEHIRTSMNKVLEVALLVGGVVAAEAMAAQFNGITGSGALFVVACILLNRISKKPIVEMAVGPVACIVYGVLLNVLLVCNLITLAAAA